MTGLTSTTTNDENGMEALQLTDATMTNNRSNCNSAAEEEPSKDARTTTSNGDAVDKDEDIMAPPDEFICCITQEIMREPTMSKYGHSYERSAILQWISQNGTCPMSRKPLKPSNLATNAALEQRIRQWMAATSTEYEQVASTTTTTLTKSGLCCDQVACTCALSSLIGSSMMLTMQQQPQQEQTRRTRMILNAPAEFFCPLTTKLLRDPIMLRNGCSFERQAVIQALEQQDSTASYNYLCLKAEADDIALSDFVPNTNLKQRISNYCRSEGGGALQSVTGRQQRQYTMPRTTTTNALRNIVHAETNETLDQLLDRCIDILET